MADMIPLHGVERLCPGWEADQMNQAAGCDMWSHYENLLRSDSSGVLIIFASRLTS